MQIYSVAESDQQVLCDTPRCRAEIQRLQPGASLPVAAASPEVVLCVIEGSLEVQGMAEAAGDRSDLPLGSMEGVQIPAGWLWTSRASSTGAKILRVDSPHPGFDLSRRLMPPLSHLQPFAVAHGQALVYTDYVRGGVLTFAPGFAADKHYHQDAEEIFWFFSGTCRVTSPDGPARVDAGKLVYTPAGEWHIIENIGPDPLLMFLTVTPNIVPSHTFFHDDGTPFVRSMAPLTHL